MVRVALASFAHVHARGYAQQVKENPDAEIVCVWDDSPERGRPPAEEYGVPFIEDYDGVLARDDVDGIVLNAETSKHPDLILRAAAAKKHLFTEKALSIRTTDADELVQAVNAAGIKFMISLPSRTRPPTLFMKQVLDEGLLGDVTMMRARVAHSAALDKWFGGGSAWFTDAELAGGGALFDLGCHTVDVMRWLMGKPKSVVAQISNFSHQYDIDDNSVVAVEFESGALGILDTAFVHRSGPNLQELYGTEGCLLNGVPGFGLMFRSRQLKPGDLDGWTVPENLPPALPTPLQQWIAALARDGPMTITIEDGRNLTQLLDAAYQSAREGRRVDLSA
jgi:predicted dehydrogenase